MLTIAGIGVPLFSRTTTPLREALVDVDDTKRDLSLRPKQAQFRLDMRAISASLGQLIGARPARWLVPRLTYALVAVVELAMLLASMQVAITLPGIWYFHRVNAHALWANMVVIPLRAS